MNEYGDSSAQPETPELPDAPQEPSSDAWAVSAPYIAAAPLQTEPSAVTTQPQAPAPPPAPWWSTPVAPSTSTVNPMFANTVPGTKPKSARPILMGAIVGALVGSLVTGGLFIAFRDDAPQSTNTQSSLVDLTNVTTGTKADSGAVAPTKTGGIDLHAVINRIRPAVVTIKVQTASGQAGGTGFIVESDGTIVTNAHVVNGAQGIKITLSDGDVVDATVRGTDVGHDLAVIKIDRSGLPTAFLGDSDRMSAGDPVVAVGNALGLGVSVTQGIVSAVDRDIHEPNSVIILGALQTDAAINPGNSGGPLVNAKGEVIGINTAIASPTESNNVGFAISVSSAALVIDALAAGRTPKDAFLGVKTDDVTPSLARDKNLKATVGAYINGFSPGGSPAQSAGLAIGDVVVKVAGTAVTGREQMRRLIRRHPANSAVEFVIVTAAGVTKTLTIKLGEAPPVVQN